MCGTGRPKTGYSKSGQIYVRFSKPDIRFTFAVPGARVVDAVTILAAGRCHGHAWSASPAEAKGPGLKECRGLSAVADQVIRYPDFSSKL